MREKPTKSASGTNSQAHFDRVRINAEATTPIKEEWPDGKDKSAGGEISGVRCKVKKGRGSWINRRINWMSG